MQTIETRLPADEVKKRLEEIIFLETERARASNGTFSPGFDKPFKGWYLKDDLEITPNSSNRIWPRRAPLIYTHLKILDTNPVRIILRLGVPNEYLFVFAAFLPIITLMTILPDNKLISLVPILIVAGNALIFYKTCKIGMNTILKKLNAKRI